MHQAKFHVNFRTKTQREYHGFAELVVELPFAPAVDVEIQHPAWHGSKKPLCVSYDLDTASFYVYLADDDLDSLDCLDQHVENYRALGWSVRG